MARHLDAVGAQHDQVFVQHGRLRLHLQNVVVAPDTGAEASVRDVNQRVDDGSLIAVAPPGLRIQIELVIQAPPLRHRVEHGCVHVGRGSVGFALRVRGHAIPLAWPRQHLRRLESNHRHTSPERGWNVLDHDGGKWIVESADSSNADLGDHSPVTRPGDRGVAIADCLQKPRQMKRLLCADVGTREWTGDDHAGDQAGET